MSDVSLWRMFAFMDDDQTGAQDESRSVAEWQIQDVLRWATTRGYDNIYLRRVPGEPARFRKTGPVGNVRHIYSGGHRGDHASSQPEGSVA